MVDLPLECDPPFRPGDAVEFFTGSEWLAAAYKDEILGSGDHDIQFNGGFLRVAHDRVRRPGSE